MSNQMELFPMDMDIDFTVKRVENGYVVSHYRSGDTKPEVHVCTTPGMIGTIIMTAMAKDRIESSTPPMSDLMGPPC